MSESEYIDFSSRKIQPEEWRILPTRPNGINGIKFHVAPIIPPALTPPAGCVSPGQAPAHTT